MNKKPEYHRRDPNSSSSPNNAGSPGNPQNNEAVSQNAGGQNQRSQVQTGQNPPSRNPVQQNTGTPNTAQAQNGQSQGNRTPGGRSQSGQPYEGQNRGNQNRNNQSRNFHPHPGQAPQGGGQRSNYEQSAPREGAQPRYPSRDYSNRGGYGSQSSSRFEKIKAIETVEDIQVDIGRLEKEIELELKEIRGLRLGL